MQKKAEAGKKTRQRRQFMTESMEKHCKSWFASFPLVWRNIECVGRFTSLAICSSKCAYSDNVEDAIFLLPAVFVYFELGKKWLLSKSGLTTIYECWLNSLCNIGQAHHKTTTTTTIGNNIADQYQTMQVMPLNTRVRLKILGYYEISSGGGGFVIWNILWTLVLKQFNIWHHLWTISWII